MQTPKSADWLVAIPCFLFTVVLAMFAAVSDLPLALRIVMVCVAAALLGLGGALVGRSMRATGWRPSTGSGSAARTWRPSDDLRRTEADDEEGQGQQ